MLITSKHNPRVTELRRLQQRKHRERARLFTVEGRLLIREAIVAGAQIEQIIVAGDLLGDEASALVRELARRERLPLLGLAPELFADIWPDSKRDGVAGVLRQRWHSLMDLPVRAGSCFLAVNEIRQPWSIGNLVRTCEAVGAEAVILVGPSTDPYHPLAVRASLGTVFSQRLIRCSLSEFADWARSRGCLLVGTSPSAHTDYRTATYRRPLTLLMGSERHGLSEEQEAACDLMVSIPMAGRCDSHHVTVAAAVVLYEVFSGRGTQAS